MRAWLPVGSCGGSPEENPASTAVSSTHVLSLIARIRPIKLTEAGDRLELPNGAEVAELADALRSGRSELYAHVGSTPTFGTSGSPERGCPRVCLACLPRGAQVRFGSR